MSNQGNSKKMEKIGIAGNQQVVKVNGKLLKLTKVSSDGEKIKGSWEFLPFKDVLVKCKKMVDSPKVVCSVWVHGKEIASNLSAQGMFDIISQLTGIKRQKVDSLYKKSNPFRKDGKGGNNSQQFINPDELEDIKL